MTKGYRHLTHNQRCQIYTLKTRGDSASLIAKTLCVHRSTISREVRRNNSERGYQYDQANLKAQNRRSHSSNKKLSSEMLIIIEEKLKMEWSPEQISGWMKKKCTKHVSYETIYKYIWADKKRGGFLYKHLRHRGKKYNKRSKGSAGRGCIPDRIDIKERPSIVEKKVRLGDWELDTIVGSLHTSGAIVSMVDKTAKLTKLVKVKCKTATEVTHAIIERLNPIRELVLTLTADNGKEFAFHKIVSEALDVDFFFATPYHSWERGLNEHTNGLVRQYFPKGTNFNDISETDIYKVEELLNNRPRKSLGFETPLEAFNRLSIYGCLKNQL